MRPWTVSLLAALAMGCVVGTQEAARSGIVAGGPDPICDWIASGVELGVIAADPDESNLALGVSLDGTSDGQRAGQHMTGFLQYAGDVDWMSAVVRDTATAGNSFAPGAELVGNPAYGTAIRLCGSYLVEGEPAAFECELGTKEEIERGNGVAPLPACCATNIDEFPTEIRLSAGSAGHDDSGELLLRVDRDPGFDAMAGSQCGAYMIRYGATPPSLW